jgi:5-methylcytosine-specific restriction endonuclease McrA
MAKRQVRWAKAQMVRIRTILGGRCAECGEAQRLELDCIIPQGHKHHAAGLISRVCFYRKQMRFGNLQVLCSKCHSKKTAKDMGWTLTSSVKEIEEPY